MILSLLLDEVFAPFELLDPINVRVSLKVASEVFLLLSQVDWKISVDIVEEFVNFRQLELRAGLQRVSDGSLGLESQISCPLLVINALLLHVCGESVDRVGEFGE